MNRYIDGRKAGFWAVVLLAAHSGLFSQTLTLQDYLRFVRVNHPVAQQSFLLDKEADAALLQARGGFDPKLYGDWERKSFDGKNYFNIGEGGVKVPTWFGLEGKLAYNATSGIFLNPENKLPSNGQAIVGLTVPLLQGMMMDERRAGLFQARIMRSANEKERRLLLNDLLFDAAKTYWDWALAYEWLAIFDRAVDLANQRFEGLRASFFLGDKPAIDTLEAFIQVQDRIMQRNDARVVLRNANLALQNFRWGNENPLPVDSTLLPINLDTPSEMPAWLTAPVDDLAATHPEVLQYDFKIRHLEVERRLKSEMLKPRLDLNYNLLGNGADFRPDTPDGATADLLRDNYKLGAQFSFPLLLRKERGSLQLTDLKLMDANFALSQKSQLVRNKISIYKNDLENLGRQIQLALQVRDNYARLLDAETERFAIGESSIFLINSRENKLIEAEVKLAKLQADRLKTEAGLQWAAGRLE